MSYDEIAKRAALKYKKNKQHPVSLAYKQDEWNTRIHPAIERSGMPTATFIKKAIDEKIERDGLDRAEHSDR